MFLLPFLLNRELSKIRPVIINMNEVKDGLENDCSKKSLKNNTATTAGKVPRIKNKIIFRSVVCSESNNDNIRFLNRTLKYITTAKSEPRCTSTSNVTPVCFTPKSD